MRWEAFAAALLAVPSIALAQQVDPRLAAPAVQLLQGQVGFLEARLKVQQDDAEALRVKLCALVPEDKRGLECAPRAAAEAKGPTPGPQNW